MSIYEDAAELFQRGAVEELRQLLEPLAMQGDLEAQTALGTYLSLSESSRAEGLRLLKQAADHGYGHAAHNLATALVTGNSSSAADRAAYRKYMEIASRSGFEATVASNVSWWRCDPEDD